MPRERTVAASPTADSTARTIEEVLDAIQATIEGDEIDFDDVTTADKAKTMALEIIGHVRDQLCDVVGKPAPSPGNAEARAVLAAAVRYALGPPGTGRRNAQRLGDAACAYEKARRA